MRGLPQEVRFRFLLGWAMAMVCASADVAAQNAGSFFDEDIRIHKPHAAHQGFYMGLMAGLSSSHMKGSLVTSRVANPTTISLKEDQQTIDYAFVLGYGFLLDPHNIYLGMESDIAVGGGSMSLTDSTQSHTQEIKRKHRIGLSFLVGIGREVWVLYGVVGFVNARFDMTTTTPHLRQSNSVSAEAVRLGGGIAFALNHDVFLRSDYNYLKYGTMDDDIHTMAVVNQSSNNVQVVSSNELSEHVITLGVFYRF